MNAERTPPHDLELEKMLVSQAMQSREAFGDVAEIIPHEDRFHGAGYRVIWQAMRELHGKGEHWDLPLLCAYLNSTGRLADAGGYASVADVYGASPTTITAMHYAHRVRDLWLLRAMAYLGSDMSRDASEMAGGQPSEIRAKYESQIFRLGEESVTGKPITSQELAGLVMDKIDRIGNGEHYGLPFGFHDLDRVFLGMAPKTVTLLAGRPGGGKTKLAINVAMKLANDGKRGAVFSLEMANEELGLRMACAISGIESQLVTQNKLDENQNRLLNEACNELASYPIYWQDKPGLKPTELLASLRRLKRHNAIEYAVVDHILLMQPDVRHGRSRNDEVGEISRMVKLAAKETGIPILALCQMNRGVEQRNDPPRLSDLRDSGNLEQDADNVIFLHKPREEQTDTVEIYVAKQRNGPTGKCTLYDRKGVFRFENYAGQA